MRPARRLLRRRFVPLTVTLIAVSLAAGINASGWGNVPVGKALPRITLRTVRGNKPVSIPPKGSKGLVLMYIKANQSRSADALADLITLYRKYKPKGVHIVVVATPRHKGRQAAYRLAKKLKAPFPLVMDKNGAFRGLGGLFIYPTTGVADSRGILRYEYSGHRPDYAIAVERQIRAVLGIGPPPDQIKDYDRNAVSKEDRAKSRRSRLKKMMRKLELKRAKRRFFASSNLLTEDTLPMIFKLYAAWSSKLPEPEHEGLLAAVALVEKGALGAGKALSSLQKLSKDKKIADEATLWLGRALLLKKKAKAARAAFERCAGKSALRGQCEFELARLRASKDPAGAVALCKKGYKLAFGDE